MTIRPPPTADSPGLLSDDPKRLVRSLLAMRGIHEAQVHRDLAKEVLQTINHLILREVAPIVHRAFSMAQKRRSRLVRLSDLRAAREDRGGD